MFCSVSITQHPLPLLPSLHTLVSPLAFAQGGETAALARLKYYLWDSDLLATYFDSRNGMLGGDYSTKFAPWLAAGCLSPRMVFHEVGAIHFEAVHGQ